MRTGKSAVFLLPHGRSARLGPLQPAEVGELDGARAMTRSATLESPGRGPKPATPATCANQAGLRTKRRRDDDTEF